MARPDGASAATSEISGQYGTLFEYQGRHGDTDMREVACVDNEGSVPYPLIRLHIQV